MIRAKDLIFSYVVPDWLMGQQPPAFGLLAWNADTTRRPAATARGGRTGPSGRPVPRRPRRAAEHGAASRYPALAMFQVTTWAGNAVVEGPKVPGIGELVPGL